MFDFFNLQFFVGIIIGGLVVALIYPLFKKKNELGSFKDSLDEIDKKIEGIKKENLTYQGSITTTLTNFVNKGADFEQIAKEMKNTLVAGSSQKQGAWGEMVLGHILSKLQFTEGEEFEKHKTLYEESERQIPDIIVHFPQNRDVIIDSKVNLTAWDDYVNSDNEKDKEEALVRHKQAIKAHIDSLANKKYQNLSKVKSLDSVIMFCPNESAISSLGAASRKMMDYAIGKKITLVGPAMLYFTLKTVEYFWKAEKQSKNVDKVIEIANKISDQSREIYDSAEGAVKGIKKSSEGITGIMNKIKDGRGSLLGKVDSMNKIGGLYPKKKIPEEVKEELDNEIILEEDKKLN